MSPPLWSFTNTRLSMIIIANYGSIIMVILVGSNVCPLLAICIVLTAGPFKTYFMDICTQIQNLYFLHVLLKTPPAKCWYIGVLMTFLFPYHWHLTENETCGTFSHIHNLEMRDCMNPVDHPSNSWSGYRLNWYRFKFMIRLIKQNIVLIFHHLSKRSILSRPLHLSIYFWLTGRTW